MIFKLAKDRDEDSKDIKGRKVLKDGDGKVVFDIKEVLKIWEKYFRDLLNSGTDNEERLDKPISVRNILNLKGVSTEEVSTALRKMRQAKPQEQMNYVLSRVGVI